MTFGQPDLKPCVLEGGREGYRLDAPDGWAYEWTHGEVTRRLVVPHGWTSDGGSVPRWLWSITGLTPDGLARRGYFVHDCLYHWAGTLPKDWLLELDPITGLWLPIGELPQTDYPREEADRMFAAVLREDQVRKSRRRRAYLGVRIGGWIAWLRHKRARRRERGGGLGA